MRIDRRMTIWVAVGAGLGAVLRSALPQAWSGLTGLVAVAVTIVVGGLLGGVALALPQSRGTAVVLGVAAGASSAGFYAVSGITAGLQTGIVFLIAVPLLTGTALTVGVSAVGILRHRHRRRQEIAR